MDIGPLRAPRPHEIAPCSIRQHGVDRPPPLARFSDDVDRVFDPSICCWVAVKAPELAPVKPARGPVISGDGSGVWWEIRETSGQLFGKIEAQTFDLALIVKREICRQLGGVSGHAKLWPIN